MDSHDVEDTKELLVDEQCDDNMPVLPRIGYEYQVEVPSVATETDHRLLLAGSLENGCIPGFGYPVDIGLPVPLTWDDHLGVKVIKENEQLNNGSIEQAKRIHSFIPLPGVSFSSWTDGHKQQFILGLYLFGKNLAQVRKFMDCKNMGNVLAYYYGEFYHCDVYKRWSDYRKRRTRRCVLGQHIFTGWRQQALLLRLQSIVPEEARESVSEVFRSFNEAKLSLENVIFELKARIGVEALVEAIGIGKGKLDLTTVNLEPVKTNRSDPAHTDVPVGRACSSLSACDIVKFLTGDFRLSKAKSSDLFWEAVWPRLLARGWHSEQPRESASAAAVVASKNSLVFLLPGVKKFSRKKLVKGNHYFDSVSDVLKKVASEPGLLELELDGENSVVDHNDDDDNDLDQSCRNSTSFQDVMKFTVVDTSMANEEGGPFKVRELRSLPFDILCHFEHPHKSASSSTSVSNSHDLYSDNPEVVGAQVAMNLELADAVCNKTKVTDVTGNFTRQPRKHQYLSPVAKCRRMSADSEPAKVSEVPNLHVIPVADVEEAMLKEEVGPSPSFDPPLVEDTVMADDVPSAAVEINGVRRHGTRSRLPTARVLEAVAFGFLGTKRKGRDLTAASLRKRTVIRPPRRPQKLAEETPDVIMDDNKICS